MKRLLKIKWTLLFVAASFFLMSDCATAPPAKKEAKVPPAKKEEPEPAAPAPKKMTEADGVYKDGEIIRKNSPAFTLEYPTNFKMRKKFPGQIFNGANPAGVPSLEVGVYDLDKKGWEAHIKGTIDTWKNILRGLGSRKVKIIRSEPTDRYDEFKAQEIEIEWLWTDGNTMLISLVNIIEKEGKVISLSGTVVGDTNPLINIFETIDLDPL